MKLPALALIVTSLAACTPPRPAAAPEPITVPAPSPSPGDGDGSEPGEPTPPAPPTGVHLKLVPASPTVRAGDKLVVSLVNAGDQDFVFRFPGATNGCGAFRWSLDLVRADGARLTRDYHGPDRACTAVMIPPHDVIVKAGESVQMTVDTAAQWYLTHTSDPGQPLEAVGAATKTSLEPGKYTVLLGSAGLQLQASISITAP